MSPQESSDKPLSPVVTNAMPPAESSKTRRRAPRGEGRKKVLEYLKTTSWPENPKPIAFNTGLNQGEVRQVLRRMDRDGEVQRVQKQGVTIGYILPKRSFEQDLEKALQLDGQKQTLPRFHDIHLTFKPENVKIALSNPDIWRTGVQVAYEPGLGAQTHLPSEKLHIPSNKTLPRLGNPERSDYLNRFFNTLDPLSIYQLWKENRNEHQDLSGGFQETFKQKNYKIIVQLYGTGTIKVLLSNSEHPFDAMELQQALDTVNGLFIGKCGVQFYDISNFFFFEKLHVGNDIVADYALEGQTRLCCTITELTGWLYRVYEKVLGKDNLVIRSEACLERGANYQEHNFNGVLALIQGGVTPSLVQAATFRNGSQIGQLEEYVKRGQNQIHGLFSVAQKHEAELHELKDMVAELVRLTKNGVVLG